MLQAPWLLVSLIRQVGYVLRERRAQPRRSSPPDAPLPLLDMRPWYRELPTQLTAILAEPRNAPANFASRAADVPDIWQDYLPNPFSWANSALVHLLVLTALVLPFALRQRLGPAQPPHKIFDLTPLVLALPQLHGHAEETHGGGSGGDRSPLPPSRGVLPPFARIQFAPPMANISNFAALLPMSPTLVGPPELKLPGMDLNMPWGAPAAVPGLPSSGPGTGGGIGDHDGTGVGTGEGPGYGPGHDGGCCDGALSVGNGVMAPIPIYAPEPAYSEEARKAKFGGIVTLWIVVDPQGNVRNVQVVKHLGMGLDEEAENTVSTWKFKPGTRQGVPVPVRVMVEVSFRLF